MNQVKKQQEYWNSAESQPETICSSENNFEQEIIVVQDDEHVILNGKVRHPPLLPTQIAGIVSSISMASRISLRLASLCAEMLFDSLKLSAVATLGISRRTFVSAISSAKNLHAITFGKNDNPGETGPFLKVLDHYTTGGVYAIHTVFSLAELLSLSTFHLYSSTIRFTFKMAEETVHVLDGLFGETETSKALAAFICIFLSELKGQDDALGLTKRFGKIKALGMVTKAMTAYCCLQFLNRKRWKEELKLTPIFSTILPKKEGSYDPSAKVAPLDMFKSVDSQKIPTLLKVSSVEMLSRARSLQLKPTKSLDDFVIGSSININHTPSRMPRKRAFSGPDQIFGLTGKFKISAESVNTTAASSRRGSFASKDCTPKMDPKSRIQMAGRFVKFATGAYGSSMLKILGIEKPRKDRFKIEDEQHQHFSLANHADIDVANVITSSHDNISTLHAPSLIAPVHYVIIDPISKSIVVSLRGTLGFSDMMTDLVASYEQLSYNQIDGYVHSGIYHSARALADGSIKDAVIKALNEYPDYNLILTGHSLGGGCAALLSLLWSECVEDCGSTSFYTSEALGFPKRLMHAYVYSCPAIMSPQLSNFLQNLVTTFVYRHDIVPCLSLGLIGDFRNVTISLCNEQGMAEGIIGKVLGIFRELRPHGENPMEDDLWYWALLKTLKADMKAEKLYPPGKIYWINAVDSGRLKPTTAELNISEVDDVERAFSEIYFSTSMFTDQ